jgi:predicted Zn-dependent peptidase
MKEIKYDTLKETLYYEQLDNGLKVFVLPKPGFSKTYGLFSTRFGSIDTTFIPLGEKEMITVPDGVAHFLEHKMFDTSKGDASELFAKLGASTNAFTSSSRTAYLFNTTANEYECIELLLDFVQEECLSDESVEKEKGIINQEIGMYDDDADWRCYFGSISNLYQNHPVKIDIAGTVDTVNSIDKDILLKCYRTFYHPSNMMLFVVGNIDAKKTIELVKNNQSKKSFRKQEDIIRKENHEPKDIDKSYEELKMDVVMPKVIVSMKINDVNHQEKLKKEMAMNLLLDILFSKSSSIYDDMLNEGLINDSFSASFTQERDYSFLQVGGDTYEPEKLKDRLIDLLSHISDIKIDEKDFMRNKKKNIGILINMFNSPESIANIFTRYYFEDIMAFDLIDAVNDLTIDDLYDLYPLFDQSLMSTFIVNPKN